jgi:hypothetical protein
MFPITIHLICRHYVCTRLFLENKNLHAVISVDHSIVYTVAKYYYGEQIEGDEIGRHGSPV